jgi:hypothetical protein
MEDLRIELERRKAAAKGAAGAPAKASAIVGGQQAAPAASLTLAHAQTQQGLPALWDAAAPINIIVRL